MIEVGKKHRDESGLILVVMDLQRKDLQIMFVSG